MRAGMAGSRNFRCVVIISLAHSRSFGRPPCPVLPSTSLPSLSTPSSRSMRLLFPEPAAEAASSSTVPATFAVVASEAEPLTEVLHATMSRSNHGEETFLVLCASSLVDPKAAIAGVDARMRPGTPTAWSQHCPTIFFATGFYPLQGQARHHRWWFRKEVAHLHRPPGLVLCCH
jgi:hypothetical protein